ncbi:VOC family protein [Occultella kanbiaonis]|uniref:VOC family protein n=1 Tax=Occultella kanbiaonis TaxID=2675754 RepID=UPI0012B96830|nr:VOC family protein [Occultella kanbiaonis]
MAQVDTAGFWDAEGAPDWRVVDGRPSTWFEAPSMSAGAELVARVTSVAAGAAAAIDLRAGGVRVRLGGRAGAIAGEDVEIARAVSAAARDLALVADPAVLQAVRLVVDASDRTAVLPFWRTVLGYGTDGEDALVDPLGRWPGVSFAPQDPRRPLRNRMHVDVVRVAESVTAALATTGQVPHGPFGLALADPDGNVVDLVPGGNLGDGPETSDWRAIFGAMTHYRTDSPSQGSALATTVATLADEAGEPLLVDLRPDGVTIDSGKDQFEDADGGTRAAFVELAAAIQAAARGLGLSAAPEKVGFVQYGIDAVDIPTTRAFWTAALGYRLDPRAHLTDIYDPRRLNPVLFFQDLDAADTERRRQRDRLHLEVFVPPDRAAARVETAVTAGGRLVGEQDGRWTVADPEGNEITFRADGS